MSSSFRALHEGPEAFLLPNPWNAGTARILATLGYEALATTSAGFAHSLGRPDGAVTRDEALDHAGAIVGATKLPVSADLERGFADDPEGVAATIRLAGAAGLAGASIEDHTGDDDHPIYGFGLAVERVSAAAEAARSLPGDFVLTARAENFFHDVADLDDTIRRLQAFEEAGADVLYAPGLPGLDAVRAVVESVGRPVNALADPRYTVAEMRATGVKRISLGSWFSRTALAAFTDAARELVEDGTFGFVRPSPDFNELFAGR